MVKANGYDGMMTVLSNLGQVFRIYGGKLLKSVVFDEIDAGVSGKTARKIGIKLLQLSKNTQMFSVTHSAQIASLADRHLLISKSDVEGRTQTAVSELDYDGRVSELSRILGGIAVTEAQKRAAVDMIKERELL
jgi:DNA repair protein RecN (Recombination protein N)